MRIGIGMYFSVSINKSRTDGLITRLQVDACESDGNSLTVMTLLSLSSFWHLITIDFS